MVSPARLQHYWTPRFAQVLAKSCRATFDIAAANFLFLIQQELLEILKRAIATVITVEEKLDLKQLTQSYSFVPESRPSWGTLAKLFELYLINSLYFHYTTPLCCAPSREAETTNLKSLWFWLGPNNSYPWKDLNPQTSRTTGEYTIHSAKHKPQLLRTTTWKTSPLN